MTDKSGSSSLRNLLEKPRSLRASCSLSTVTDPGYGRLLPCLNDVARTCGGTRRASIAAGSHSSRRRSSAVKSVSSTASSSLSDLWSKQSEKARPSLAFRLPCPTRSSSSGSRTPIPVSLSRSSSASVTASGVTSLLQRPGDGDVSSSATFAGTGNRDKAEDFSGVVTGPSLCTPSFEVGKSDLNDHYVNPDDGGVDESRVLANWERWMRIRRRMCQRFAEKTKRDKCDLVMNSGDDVREVIEEKTLLTYACIDPPDKWRGDPSFWRAPKKLPEKDFPADYHAATTKMEMGQVPVMETVIVPDAVKKEKDLLCGGKVHSGWIESEYRKKQKLARARELEKLAPHKVDGRELVVVGKGIEPEKENDSSILYNVPAIQITPPTEPAPNESDSVVVLAVNGVEMRYRPQPNDCGREDVTGGDGHTWSLVFDESAMGEVTCKALHVENRGTASVRYMWTRDSEPDFAGFVTRRTAGRGGYFFFDKNPGIFLPGQRTVVTFYHMSSCPGYQTETWRLRLNLLPEGRVRLTAITARSCDVQEDCLRIDRYLRSCVAESTVRETVSEIVRRVKPEVPSDIEYRSLFMEEELFEYQNPTHHYRYDIVAELKKLFDEVPLEPRQDWDLNLSSLEELIRTRASPDKKQHEMLCHLMSLTRCLLRPGPERYDPNNKQKMAYNALCSVMSGMEANAEMIRRIFADESDSDVEDGSENVDNGGVGGEEEDASEGMKLIASPSSVVFQVKGRDVAAYRFAIYTMVFNYLCEAAENVAGIVQTCKLFEHKGEVITPESLNFFVPNMGKSPPLIQVGFRDLL